MSELFEELAVGPLHARNRLVRAATAESLCTLEGAPSKRLITFYRELAEGGVGTIITGFAYVCPDGQPAPRALGICDDSFEALYRELVDGVHEEGARIVLQLVYGGSKSVVPADDPRRIGGEGREDEPNVDILGPSAIAHPKTGLVPRPATTADLMRVCAAFASAAARAKRCGFDGVEVHAAHGYLLSQFLDGRFNKREDEYGGSLENRARLALGCVRAIRSKVGDDFPVFVKLNSCDAYDDPQGAAGGLSEDESLRVAAWLVEAGASCIDVSGDWHRAEPRELSGEPFFGAYGTRLAAKLSVPVIVTGGWRDPDTIARYLETTQIAAVGLGRALICDPGIPMRWQEGDRRATECISCNFCSKPGIPCIQRKGR